MKTKKIFSLFLILSLSTSVSIWAEETGDQHKIEPSCDITGNDVTSITNIATAKNCLEPGFLVDKCKCLRSEAEKNVLANEQVKIGEDQYKIQLEQSKTSYREQFDRVYEKVTVQAAAQEEVLGISSELSPVGCTPQDISTYSQTFREKTQEAQLKALKELRDQTQSDLETCKRDGTFKIIRFRMNSNGCDYYKSRLELMDEKIDNFQDMECKFAINALNQKDTKDKVNEVIADYHLNKKSDSKTDLKVMAWQRFLSGEVTLEKLLEEDFKGDCSQIIKSYSNVMKRHAELQKNIAKGSEAIPTFKNDKDHCQEADLVCKAFSEKNKNLLAKTQAQFKPNDADCVTYAEYATFKGMPGPDLLKELATSSHPEKVFDFNHSGKKYVQALQFLQANPMVAVVAKGQHQADLGVALKKMAKNILANQAGGEAAAFRGYLGFMKGDFNDLYKKEDSAKMEVCTELARNYTAINMSNELPKIENASDDNDDDLKKINRLVRFCTGKTYEGTATTQLKKSLELSPIYGLGNAIEDSSASGTFEEFKDKYCTDYVAYKAKNCSGIDAGECRAGFQKTGPFSQYAEVMEKEGIASEISDAGFSRISAKTDVTKQDQAFKDDWLKKVWPNISKQAIGGRRDFKKFASGIENNKKIFSGPNVPSRYEQSAPIASPETPSSNNSPVASPLAQSQSKPGQQIPDYAKEVPTFDPKKLANASGPKDLIPNFEKLPLEEKKQSLSDVKKFVASQENPPFEAKEVDKELDKVNEEMTKEIAELGEKFEKVKGATVSQAGAPKSSGTNFSTRTQSAATQQSGSSSPTSVVFSDGSGKNSSSTKTAKAAKAAKAYNDHLIKTNEERSGVVAIDGQSRGPASIVEAPINFQKGVVDPSILQQGLIVSEVVPASHEEYEKIKGNLDQLKKYLATQIDPKQIKGPMVYKIKDPMESPDSYILFHVSQASNGAINVKTIDRKSTLKSLNNNLK